MEKLVPDPFIKKSKLNISLGQQCEILKISFFFMSIFEVYQNILKPRCGSHAFALCESFKKLDKRSKTSLPTSFSVKFLKRNISHLISLTEFHCLKAFTSWDIGWYVHCIYLLPVYDVVKFEIYLSFLIKTFSYMTKKSR